MGSVYLSVITFVIILLVILLGLRCHLHRLQTVIALWLLFLSLVFIACDAIPIPSGKIQTSNTYLIWYSVKEADYSERKVAGPFHSRVR